MKRKGQYDIILVLLPSKNLLVVMVMEERSGIHDGSVIVLEDYEEEKIKERLYDRIIVLSLHKIAYPRI